MTNEAPRQGSRHTSTPSFGSGRRESHDASAFYRRFTGPQLSEDETIYRPAALLEELGAGRIYEGSIDQVGRLPDNSVALVVTSPPYFVGKEYENEIADTPTRVPATYSDFLEMLGDVLAECVRVLEPGGRIAINVANLGRKPYRSLSADIMAILQDDLRLLLRGEVIWEKGPTSSGSCAWGSFAKPSNPVLRDMTERILIASKGRFSRALSARQRHTQGLPWVASITNDEFVEATRDVWRIDPASAIRIGHPAPFPLEVPRRLINLYTYVGDIVLDPFAGSGTTLVAAAMADRIGVGYETNQKYVAMARDRLAAQQRDREAELSAPQPRSIGHTGRSLSGLSYDQRLDHFMACAVSEGKKVADIARRRLEAAGFELLPARRQGQAQCGFRVASPISGKRWQIEVGGAFTVTHPGLQRIDAIWRLLGRMQLYAAQQPTEAASHEPVIVLTPNLARPASPADRALRAIGPDVLYDVIELYDPDGIERLNFYGRSPDPRPKAGFWSSQQTAINDQQRLTT